MGGGGDTAMEEALVLARTSKSVTIIHRRDDFRASKVLAHRVLDHPSINFVWNSVVRTIKGEIIESINDGDDVDLDNAPKIVTGVLLEDVNTKEENLLSCDAVFVAIGHTPETSFLESIVQFDEDHKGYVKTVGKSTITSVPGIFASGDVSDAVYRQAVTSAGSGAAAALDAERWLSEEGLGNEAAEFEAELLRELLEDLPTTTAATTETTNNVYDSVNTKGYKESM